MREKEEQSVTFADVNVGQKFTYDNERFRKESDRTAWSLREGRQYKQWAFQGDEEVTSVRGRTTK